MMKFSGVAVGTLMCAAGLSVAGAASAADLAAPEAAIIETAPSPIDVAFGVKFTSEYVFRGVQQADKGPAVQGYAEVQAFDWIYAGVWASSVKFPQGYGFSDPAAEIDVYGGLRHTWDAFTLDIGGLYYWYPGEANLAFVGGVPIKPAHVDYWEIYAKPSYAFGDLGSIGATVFWTADWVNSGADATYASVVGKLNVPYEIYPEVGMYVSGEFGKQWAGKTDGGFNLPNYLTWNAGFGFTYKAITVDFRYTDSDLSKRECAGFSGVSTWCGDRYMVGVSFDTALSKLK